MRVKGIFVLLSLAMMLVVPHLASAVPLHYFDCKECHRTGYVIDQIGTNICVRCHDADGESVPVSKRGALASGPGFTVGDASNHYGNNQHHLECSLTFHEQYPIQS